MVTATADEINEQPQIVWVATEFSINDGGRAWIETATDEDTAKRLCQERHQRQGHTDALAWHDDKAGAWMFGQAIRSARLGDTTDFYEVRRTEVQS